MIRLDLSSEPKWLDLGHGLRLHVLPITTAICGMPCADMRAWL